VIGILQIREIFDTESPFTLRGVRNGNRDPHDSKTRHPLVSNTSISNPWRLWGSLYHSSASRCPIFGFGRNLRPLIEVSWLEAAANWA
jgi:hypothetical protein